MLPGAAKRIAIDNRQDDYERLLDLTAGLGPDVGVDAVGMKAYGHSPFETAYDKVKSYLILETERPVVIRQVTTCCREGGTVRRGRNSDEKFRRPRRSFRGDSTRRLGRPDLRPAAAER